MMPMNSSMKEIDSCSIIVNGGTQWIRNLKTLQLGLGNKDEYIEVIKEQIMDYKNDELFEDLINSLDKGNMIELLKKIKID